MSEGESKTELGELKKRQRSERLGLYEGESETELRGHGGVKKLDRHEWMTAGRYIRDSYHNFNKLQLMP